jgi:hypothetical protein
VPREQPIEGFFYAPKGAGKVVRTPSQWRALFSTHTRRVENGETFFTNKATKKLEYEAYAIIRP